MFLVCYLQADVLVLVILLVLEGLHHFAHSHHDPLQSNAVLHRPGQRYLALCICEKEKKRLRLLASI